MFIGNVKGVFSKRIEILKKWDKGFEAGFYIKIHQETFGGLVAPYYIIPRRRYSFGSIEDAIKELRKEIKTSGGKLVLDKKKLDLFKERNVPKKNVFGQFQKISLPEIEKRGIKDEI